MDGFPESQASSRFAYSKLDHSKDEIRLIRFVSRDKTFQQGFSPPVELELQSVSLTARPRYHALSYVWGSNVKPDLVLVNGKSLHVTRSLYEALLRFHVDPSVELLWADALCINQVDNEEKSIQVKKMRQIFTSAVRVVAYLGTPPGSRETTVEKIALHGKELIMEQGWDLFATDRRGFQDPDQMPTSKFWQMFHLIGQRSHNDQEYLEEVAKKWGLGSADGGSFPHRDMLYFLRRPIWARVWILQEFVSARDLVLVCGLSELKFIYLIVVHWIYSQFYEWKRHSLDIGPRAGEYVSALARMEPYTSNTILTMQSMHRWNHMEALRANSFQHFPDLLQSSFRLGATDPKDRVFALLGIAKDAPNLGLTPDYSKTYKAVLIETAWRLAARGHFILDYSRGLRESKLAPDTPSWVPEWSLRSSRTLNTSNVPADLRFLAGGHTEMKIDVPIAESDYNREHLRISGIAVATTTRVGEVAHFPAPRETLQNLRTAQRFLHDLHSFAASPSVVWPAYQQRYVKEALWKIPAAHHRVLGGEEIKQTDRLLMLGKWQDVPSNRGKQSTLESSRLEAEFELLCGKRRPLQELPDAQMCSWLLRKCNKYLEALCSYSDEKRPMICSGVNGFDFLGMGPKEMEVGDRIFIMEGSHVPIVLRLGSNMVFQIVGEAYVYGMMYGEMVNGEIQNEMVTLG
ncbi:Fc.00g081120.m01.CDS01 [Cosmosporella sp. VM-42]